MSMLIKKLLTISLRSAMIVTIALCFSACKKKFRSTWIKYYL